MKIRFLVSPSELRALAGMCLLALFTAGCGDAPAPGDVPGDPGGSEPVPDNTEAVLAYYAARPDFFTFKTPADLPTGLNWQDGAHLPEIGSPEARKESTIC